jgi:hypothetical protein
MRASTPSIRTRSTDRPWIKSLVNAYSISIHHNSGESTIVAYPTSGYDERVEIRVGHEFTDYTPGASTYRYSSDCGDRYTCYASPYGHRFDDGACYWILRAIKPGDFLTIHWIRGNSNQTMEEASITQDSAQLIIRRRVKGSDTLKKAGVYQIADCICKSDSLARMIRTGNCR